MRLPWVDRAGAGKSVIGYVLMGVGDFLITNNSITDNID